MLLAQALQRKHTYTLLSPLCSHRSAHRQTLAAGGPVRRLARSGEPRSPRALLRWQVVQWLRHPPSWQHRPHKSRAASGRLSDKPGRKGHLSEGHGRRLPAPRPGEVWRPRKGECCNSEGRSGWGQWRTERPTRGSAGVGPCWMSPGRWCRRGWRSCRMRHAWTRQWRCWRRFIRARNRTSPGRRRQGWPNGGVLLVDVGCLSGRDVC